jgi:Outer membrane phospholipase A
VTMPAQTVARPASGRVLLGCVLLCGYGQAAAADDAAAACRTIADDAQRLACYDARFGPAAQAPAPVPAVTEPAAAARPEEAPTRPGSWLARLWDLDPESSRGTFELRPHQASYVLPLRYSTRPNSRPSSPAPGHSVSEPLGLDHTEAKFQLSLKLKVAENLIGDNGDLWFGYTQQSSWQLYNRSISSPVRETDHEPELIFSWRTGVEVLGWRWRLLNLGLAHQSNGRGQPLSRSWNRAYALFGLERGDYSLLVRPWKRLREGSNDDNPDIDRYMGSGDVRLVYMRGSHVLSALGRFGQSGRGLLQLDWAFPVVPRLNGYLQLTHGHGETLIDYNHRQTTLGVGVLLLPWQ